VTNKNVCVLVTNINIGSNTEGVTSLSIIFIDLADQYPTFILENWADQYPIPILEKWENQYPILILILEGSNNPILDWPVLLKLVLETNILENRPALFSATDGLSFPAREVVIFFTLPAQRIFGILYWIVCGMSEDSSLSR
jgi:hypothetical protein